MSWKRGGLQIVVKGQRFRAQTLLLHSVVAMSVAASFAFTSSTAAQNKLPCKYEVTAIIEGPFCPIWGNAPMFARGLSNHDPPWVTGFYAECVIGPFKAFVWPGAGGGGVQPITLPGVNIESSFAYDVTDTGLVVGAFAQPGVPYRGFIYDVAAGTWVQVDPIPPQGSCVIRAANNTGMVVGNSTISKTAYNAFIFHDGVYTDLGVMNGPYSEAFAVNEIGHATGWTGTGQAGNSNLAFLSTGNKISILPILPDGIAAEGWAINQEDEIVGWGTFNLSTGASRTRAVVWRNGEITNLGVLDGFRHSVARGISNDGRTIIGVSAVLETGQPANRACVWRDGAIADLNTLIPAGTGIYLSNGYAINARGEILCEGTNSSGHVAVVLSPIGRPPGDINADCTVNLDDLWLVVFDWGKSKSPADLNQDEIVNVIDLLIVIDNWTFN